MLRKAADTVYEDATLMEWDPKHYRIFVGNLGNDVNDEDLVKAFEGYPSFVKAKVVRDKVTGKTRGYGFVAYSDPQDFMVSCRAFSVMSAQLTSSVDVQQAAWKKMDGRYVGSRPVKIQKATTQVRQVQIGEKKAKELDTKKKSHVVGNKVSTGCPVHPNQTLLKSSCGHSFFQRSEELSTQPAPGSPTSVASCAMTR